MRLRRSGTRNTLANFSSMKNSQLSVTGCQLSGAVAASQGLTDNWLLTTSTLPPAFSIFSWADLENLWARTVMALENSPWPSTFTGDFLELTTPALRSSSGVISLSPRLASRPRFTTSYSVLKMLVKPRLGRRRCSGIWPPSKPRMMREPLRDLWPLWPRVEVLPMPEPIPRPTRLRFSVAFRGARKLLRFILYLSSRQLHWLLATDNFNQMRDLGHHASDRGRVFALDHLVQSRETKSLDYQLVLDRGCNGRPYPLELDLRTGLGYCRFRLLASARHDYSSSTALPRCAATSLRSRSLPSASNVALMTLCGLVVPMDFVSTFCTPAEVITARTAPPAITPVPSGAGFSITMPAP